MKIKNLRITNNGWIALLMAGTIIFSVSGNSKDRTINETIQELIESEDVKEITLLDELIEDGYLQSIDGRNLIENADCLIHYMDIVERLESIDFTGVEELHPLREEDYEKALSLTDEEIRFYSEAATKKAKTQEEQDEKLYALKMLNYLNNYIKEWIRQNGTGISINMLMAAVKGSIAAELGLSEEEYETIRIPENRKTIKDDDFTYTIMVGNKSYSVPTKATGIWDGIEYIYEMQSATFDEDDSSSSRRYQTYRKAIQFAKMTMILGVDINDRDIVSNEHPKKYIRERKKNS